MLKLIFCNNKSTHFQRASHIWALGATSHEWAKLSVNSFHPPRLKSPLQEARALSINCCPTAGFSWLRLRQIFVLLKYDALVRPCSDTQPAVCGGGGIEPSARPDMETTQYTLLNENYSFAGAHTHTHKGLCYAGRAAHGGHMRMASAVGFACCTRRAQNFWCPRRAVSPKFLERFLSVPNFVGHKTGARIYSWFAAIECSRCPKHVA